MKSYSFKYSVRVNQNSTVRLKIGAFLRIAADLFDGRITAAFEFRSRPALSVSEKAEIINTCIKSAGALTCDTVRAKAIEDLMRSERGELYGPLA